MVLLATSLDTEMPICNRNLMTLSGTEDDVHDVGMQAIEPETRVNGFVCASNWRTDRKMQFQDMNLCENKTFSTPGSVPPFGRIPRWAGRKKRRSWNIIIPPACS